MWLLVWTRHVQTRNHSANSQPQANLGGNICSKYVTSVTWQQRLVLPKYQNASTREIIEKSIHACVIPTHGHLNRIPSDIYSFPISATYDIVWHSTYSYFSFGIQIPASTELILVSIWIQNLEGTSIDSHSNGSKDMCLPMATSHHLHPHFFFTSSSETQFVHHGKNLRSYELIHRGLPRYSSWSYKKNPIPPLPVGSFIAKWISREPRLGS